MIDINVYINNTKNISRKKYEEYIRKFKMKSEIHPDIDFENHTGFLPFKIEVDIDFLKDKKLLAGFEYIATPYDFEQDKKESLELNISSKKPRGLKALFGRKKVVEESTGDVLVNEEIDKILANCQNNIIISFGGADSFELRMALSFACYLVETCNGALYDCYSGNWYYDNVAEALIKDINDYEKDFSESNIKIHEFEKWL